LLWNTRKLIILGQLLVNPEGRGEVGGLLAFGPKSRGAKPIQYI
jgi:hypothetical protein